jgi:hypothetical protein
MATKAKTRKPFVCDKRWPKGCQFNPKHIGECANRRCNFPACEPVEYKPAFGHKTA